MTLKNFIRFSPSPVLPGFSGGSGDLADYEEEFYAMPLKPSDAIRFIFDYTANTLFETTLVKIALLSGETVVYNDIAVLLSSKYWTVTLPSGLPEGCYRFLIYDVGALVTSSPWVFVSAACEVVTGDNTGYLDTTEQRETTSTPVYTALFVSNVFRYASYVEGTIIEFRGRQNGWGFDYETLTTFYQTFRIEIVLNQPKFPEIKKVYRQSNGIYRHSNVLIDKKVTLETQYFDELTHEAMANAIKHDEFYINGVSYFSADEYEPDWAESGSSDNRYFELSKAITELYVQGYDQRNNACGGVDEVSLIPPECLEVSEGLSITID